MRDFLEDAFEHRDDGYGRAQRAMKAPLRKRFYKRAEAGTLDDGHAVLLDGRPTQTPGRVPVRVPDKRIAAAMAVEWNAQKQEIDPETMPVVRLINAALEGGAEKLPELRAEIVKYAGTDLLYYRADTPTELREEQERLWDPILTSLARHFGISFETTRSIAHVAQPEATLAAISAALEMNGLLSAASLVLLTGITGSGLLALALRDGLITPDEAWEAAHVDENHNMRLWGADSEALKRLEKRRRDFDAGIVVLSLAGTQ